MEARHEIIPFDSDSPIHLFMHKLGDVARHWHESMELLFVLAGNVTVTAGDLRTTLNPEDMLLINSNVIHELHSEECVLIAVQIKLSKFDLPHELSQGLYFNCSPHSEAPQESFQNIKRIIASMLQSNRSGSERTLLRNRSLAYDLLGELVQNFKVKKPAVEANTHKHLERLNSILHYIGEHYQEQLTLTQLAQREHLSAPYLSSFFEKYMGVTFSTYYTDLRLKHAVHDLLHTDIPVEQVAISHGFSDPRAFVRAFKKSYNTVPSAYRKNASAPTVSAKKDPLLAINYLDFKPESYLHILTQYLPDTKAPSTTSPQKTRYQFLGSIDTTVSGKHLQHKWKRFIGVGRAKELLYAEVQDMLRQVQQQVGFRYLRFHGIFSDDMMVCRTEKDGSLHFSFGLVDKALDFVLSIGLKPLIQFSFMPASIAADPNQTIFACPFVISPPRHMEDWQHLVGAFLSHIRSRYGSKEIQTWLYSVWNEPDTSLNMFGFAHREQFFSLYYSTWQAVNAFDPSLTFGSPSLYPTTEYEVNWMSDFLSFTRSNGCLPQFMDIHYYSDNFEQFSFGNSAFAVPGFLPDDPDHFSKFLTKMDSLMNSEGISQLPLYITEWNLTVSHRNLINDTCFKAVYLAKNILETYDRADAIGYWSLTDFIEESQLSNQIFHGGLGLFTQNGIKKPPCYAMEMLAQLGDTLIASGEGWFLTRQNEQFVMMLYNYEHFDPLFLQEGFGLSLTRRDGIFPHLSYLNVEITLTGLDASTYRIRETILNQQHGSCFDSWVEMGAPELGRDDITWLQQASRPALCIHQIATPRGELPYTATLAPHEVRLVEITPANQGYQSSK